MKNVINIHVTDIRVTRMEVKEFKKLLDYKNNYE